MMTTYWNSFRITMGATALNNVLGLLLAMGVNRKMSGVLRYLLRTSFLTGQTLEVKLAVHDRARAEKSAIIEANPPMNGVRNA